VLRGRLFGRETLEPPPGLLEHLIDGRAQPDRQYVADRIGTEAPPT
jgi:hypothetical protein